MGHYIIGSLNSFKTMDSFSNKIPLCFSERYSSSAVALFVTLFICKIEQKQTILCLKHFINLFIKLLYKIDITLKHFINLFIKLLYKIDITFAIMQIFVACVILLN